MKRKNLLKLKSLIMAGVMMSFISACSKDNSDSESVEKEVKSNYSIVVMENNKAIIYDVSDYNNSNDEISIWYDFESSLKNKEVIIPASKAFIFRDENHHEEALKFAYYYCDEVIMYNDLMDHSLEDIKDQKLNLSK